MELLFFTKITKIRGPPAIWLEIHPASHEKVDENWKFCFECAVIFQPYPSELQLALCCVLMLALRAKWKSLCLILVKE